jgi:hypothetical protein
LTVRLECENKAVVAFTPREWQNRMLRLKSHFEWSSEIVNSGTRESPNKNFENVTAPDYTAFDDLGSCVEGRLWFSTQ